MARVLAFVQFLIIGIGAFTLHLLVRLHNADASVSAIERVAQFLARYALWLIPIPILWAVFSISMRNRVSEKVLDRIGIIITILLFLLLAVPLGYYLS